MKYIYFAVDADHEYIIPVSMIRITRYHKIIELEATDNRYTFKYESEDKAIKEYTSIRKWLDATFDEMNYTIYRMDGYSEQENLIGW